MVEKPVSDYPVQLPAFLTEASEQRNPTARFGFLAVICALVARNIWAVSTRTSQGNTDNLMMAVLLLLNHLAFAFRFPRPLTVTLRIAAFTLLGFLVVRLYFESR